MVFFSATNSRDSSNNPIFLADDKSYDVILSSATHHDRMIRTGIFQTPAHLLSPQKKKNPSFPLHLISKRLPIQTPPQEATRLKQPTMLIVGNNFITATSDFPTVAT